MTEILRTRTGKLSDVLEVEEKLDQVRGQIEMVEAEQKALNGQIALATIQLNWSRFTNRIWWGATNCHGLPSFEMRE